MPDTVMTTDAAPLYRNRSAEIAKLAAALCKAQAAMANAEKNANNPHFNRSYADLASVWEAVRKPLTDNGLSVVQFPRTLNNGVEIETTLLHTSGEFMCDVLWVPCSKTDAQGLGSAITYGRRYALAAVAGVAPAEDDGNAAVASHKPGVPGSAGGGGDFRPAGPRQFSSNGARMAADEPDLIDNTRQKGTLPAKPGAAGNANGKEAQSAIKRVEWVKKSIEGFKTASTKDELQEWWKTETDRLGVIENAMPAEYERLLAAYDAAIERTAARAA